MIHKFIFDDTRIVYDVHSGVLHVVDELVWDLLDDFRVLNEDALLEKHQPRYLFDEIKEALSEIKALAENGMLFSEDPLRGKYNPPKENIVKALCLHLAHDCNLECRYCFAGQGKFGGNPQLMSEEVGKKALDFLMAASGSKKNVEVDFFGGEPLMNFEVLKTLVNHGKTLAGERGKTIKFTVTSNGVNLNKSIGQFLNEHEMSVVLSLDGRPEVHDKMRPFPNGKGSHQIVLKNIREFLESRNYKDYYIRGTYTAGNRDFARDVEYFAEQGFDSISLEPVTSDPDLEYSLKPEMLEQVAEQYEVLTRMIIKMRESGKKINFFHFNIALDGGPCLPKRLSGCGAGYNYLAVDPQGGLYPCHQFVGEQDFAMGDVFNGVEKWEIGERFKNSHLYTKEECTGCWAKFLCSGGCHANAYFYGGSFDRPFKSSCILTRKRLECALFLSLPDYKSN
jgi:uncharacterized protein